MFSFKNRDMDRIIHIRANELNHVMEVIKRAKDSMADAYSKSKECLVIMERQILIINGLKEKINKQKIEIQMLRGKFG